MNCNEVIEENINEGSRYDNRLGPADSSRGE